MFSYSKSYIAKVIPKAANCSYKVESRLKHNFMLKQTFL